jgi:hypothetical protein
VVGDTVGRLVQIGFHSGTILSIEFGANRVICLNGAPASALVPFLGFPREKFAVHELEAE